MKKFFTILFFILTLAANAQYQHSNKSWNIQIGAGAQNEGNLLSIGAEKFISNKSSLSLNGYWASRNSKVDVTPRLSIMNYLGTITYNYYLFNYKDIIYPYVSAGAFIGAEEPEEALKNDFKFTSHAIYGLHAKIGSEFAFSNVALFLAATPMYELNSKNAYLIGELGIKLYLR